MNKGAYLNNLNKLLRNVAQEIVDRVTAYLKFGEEKLRNENPFTTDYEVEATVEYYLPGGDDPAHSYWMPFHYDDVIVNKDYSLLLDKDDWSEGGSPPLDGPCCYLMHDLYFHSSLGRKIFEIENIWIETAFRDQKGIKLENDGRGKRMRWNEKKRTFE